jgi:pyrroloquinoline quinone biosynthesis protein D
MTALDENARPALPRRVRIRPDPVTKEQVLLYPEGVLVLTETASAILALCDGQRTVAEICRALEEEYEAPVDELRADVLECLNDLARQNLLTVVP